MEPVKFEIVAEDKTKSGTESAGQNVDALTFKVDAQKALIISLQKEIERVQSVAAKGSDLIKIDALAKVEQYEKRIKELQASLVDLERQKEKTASTPIISPQAGNAMDVAQSNIKNLRFNVQQVARELPSLAMGPQMFFLAISNNIPILSDSIKRAREEFKLLSDEQKKSAVPVWKQLTSSIFSWQTALVLGITALVVYGKDLVNWTASLFKAKDATLELLSAEQEMALARSKALDVSKKERTELDILYSKLKNTATSSRERTAAVYEWVKKYPEYANILDGEKINLSRLEKAYQSLSKEIYANAVARAYMDKAADISIKHDKEEIKRRNQLVTLTKAQEDYNNAQDKYNQLQQQSEKGKSVGQALSAARVAYLDAEDNLKRQKKIYEEIEGNVKKYKDNYDTIINHTSTLSTFSQPKEGTFDFWTQQQNRAEGVLKNIKSDVKKTLDDASKSGKDLFSLGVDKSVVESYKKATAQIKESRENLKVYDDKVKQKRVKDTENLTDKIADAEVKAQQRIDELTIAAMRDGYEKQKAEAKRQLQQQLDQIDQEERERRQALDKARKQGINVTTSQYASVGTMAKAERDNAQQAYDNKMVALYEAEMDNLTGKSEDYTNQRIALEKEYTKEVERMTALRVEAQKKGDTQGVEMLDRSLAEATGKRGKDLIKLSFEQFQKSPEYIRAFEDLRNTSTETLQDLMKQMEAYKGVAAEAWNPQDLREYTTTLQEIIDELMNRNPYDMLIQKRRELAKAEQDVRSAQMALDAVRSGEIVVSGMTMVKGKGWVPTLLSEETALKNLNKKKDKYNKLSTETIKLERKVTDQAYELYAVLSSLGNKIGGTQGKIISFIGDFGQFTVNTITGIQDVARTGVNALSAMEKASVILTLVSTGIQFLQKLNELTPDAYDKYLKYDEKIEEINKLKDAVLDYEIAVLKAQQAEKGWFGEDNLQSLKDYKEQQKQIMEQYVAKAKEQQAIYQNKSGGGWLTNVLNYGILGGIDAVFGTNILGNNYDEGTTAAINNLRIETRKKSSGFLGSGIGGKSQKTEDLASWIKKQKGWENEDLFDSDGWVNAELAQEVLDKYGNKLVGQTKETLEELVKLRKQYDEFVAQLQEYVSQLYSPLVDNMIDGLWDWLDDGKDALDSFKGYAKDTFRDIVSDMLKTIVMKKVFGSFEDDIAKIYEKYSGNDTDMASFAAEISEKVKELTDRYEDELPYLQELLKQISTSFSQSGIDLKDSSSASQSANSSVVSQVTEETMTWLAGGMVAQTNRLISVDNNITEFRNQLTAALSPLTEIASNTKETVEKLEGIAADVLILRRDGTYIKN